MRARILLIALLVWGPIGSVVCQASCLQGTLAGNEKPVASHAAPVADAHPCHASSGPASAPEPAGSSSSHSACGCGGSNLALTVALPAVGAGSAFLASAPLVGAPASQLAPRAALRIDPPGQSLSPYQRQNPPLLI